MNCDCRCFERKSNSHLEMSCHELSAKNSHRTARRTRNISPNESAKGQAFLCNDMAPKIAISVNDQVVWRIAVLLPHAPALMLLRKWRHSDESNGPRVMNKTI